MIDFNRVNLTAGHIARHTPTGSGVPGKEAAVIDIAQDLLLAYLQDNGLMHKIAIKGGTAIRKLYAGKEGRFSIDLDFAVDDSENNIDDISFDFVSSIDGLQIGPFRYSITERRGKWYIVLDSPFNNGEFFRTKLDFASFPWMAPAKRAMCKLPIHEQYGFELPMIKTIRLEENMAEKIARLNRTNTARDIYDLNWLMETAAIESVINKPLLRTLVVLKIWIDSHGMHYGNICWRPAHASSVFDPVRWLFARTPEELDMEDIGTLAVPAPTAEDMLEHLKKNYLFLKDLDETEKIIAGSSAKDRGIVIQVLSKISQGRLLINGLY